MADVTEITFEQGYGRLQDIAARVNAEEVPVQEMCDLFAEGKGLDKALSDFLEEQKSRVEKIEKGEEIVAFKIIAVSGGEGGDRADRDAQAEIPADTIESASGPGSDGSDDEIRF